MPTLIAHLVDNGFDDMYGARHLKRLIVSLVENEIAQAMMDGKAKSGQVISVGYDIKKEKVTLNVKNRK